MSKLSSLFRWLAQRLNQLNQLPPLWAFLLICGVSIAVKLGYILTIGGGLDTWPPEGSDGEFYQRMAVALWRYGFYGYGPNHITTAMPPGQSAFFALIYATFGPSYAAAKLAQVLVITLAAGFTYLTGRLLFSPTVALFAGLLIAVDPAQAYLSATFLSDGLFIFFMLIALYALTRSSVLPNQHWLWWVLGGVCFGLAGLVRNQGWLFAIALLGLAILTRGRWINWRMSVVALCATILTIAPWTVRNYFVSAGHFIPVSSEGGLTLWASNNPAFEYRPPMPMSLPLYDAPTDLSEYDLDMYYRRLAFEWIWQNPGQFALIGLRKLYILYHFDPSSWRPQVAGLFRLAGLIPYGLMLPFIALGLLQYWRKPQLSIILAYILFTTVMAMLFYGDSRIRAPIQPYLYLLGAAWLYAKIIAFLPAPLAPATVANAG